MLSALCDIIIIFLSVIGLVELIRLIICRLFKTKGDKSIVILVPIKSGAKDAELLLRSAAAKAMWVYCGAIERVVCLDCGTDEETKKICMKICDQYEFMEYKTKL
ncbi:MULTISPECIES: hypothetical protein [unclassified Ruminococcus]|uniref:hypothetical protein n=1 Tax=unclassified Ruminococcus TaxID=2608920 RepID=UPI00210954EB|nr:MULTISPECIES: hypothetical protein [unclassified Ruminococcus]MCQ4021501.1 hypothetical protein [Ruminococcus sp. zg-924]MCQ4113946.1 hypothetical protein [Ruminococcus sp. zg-921]